jgi:hypothetical protein
MSGPRIKSTNILTKNWHLGYAFTQDWAPSGGVGSYRHFWDAARFFGTLGGRGVVGAVKLRQRLLWDPSRDLLETIKSRESRTEALEATEITDV